MVEELLIGAGFAFAAAVQPGPLQAFLLSSVVRNGWKRTLPAAFSPLISDGPIALLALLVLNGMPDAIRSALHVGGGAFLIYLAWSSHRRWKHQSTSSAETNDSTPRTLFQAATVNFLNPNPYLGWSLVLGPAFMRAWQRNPMDAAVLIIAFYVTMVAALACTILAFGTTRILGPVGRRALILVSAIVLIALGAYQVAAGFL